LYHLTIRLTLLATLYKKYFEEDAYNYYLVDDIIIEGKLSDTDRNHIEGNLNYLIEKNLILSIQYYPGSNMSLKITSLGIDHIENFMGKSLELLQNASKEDTKKIIEEAMSESNKAKRPLRLIQYLIKNPSLLFLLSKLLGY
jgi:hypothetical protein